MITESCNILELKEGYGFRGPAALCGSRVANFESMSTCFEIFLEIAIAVLLSKRGGGGVKTLYTGKRKNPQKG